MCINTFYIPDDTADRLENLVGKKLAESEDKHHCDQKTDNEQFFKVSHLLHTIKVQCRRNDNNFLAVAGDIERHIGSIMVEKPGWNTINGFFKKG
ncbi:THUMP domain-containing protein [Dyadobacter sp. MSC1_007]|uniref:THUMP domain-containing protein n=1 Tax=Dyadobacter sp. MSC1_007 TaxID=2909264 RepID=UPI0038D4B3DD